MSERSFRTALFGFSQPYAIYTEVMESCKLYVCGADKRVSESDVSRSRKLSRRTGHPVGVDSLSSTTIREYSTITSEEPDS